MDGASAIDGLGLDGHFTSRDRAAYIEVGNRGADDHRQVLAADIGIEIKDTCTTESQGRQVGTRFEDIGTTGNGETTGTILSARPYWAGIGIARYCNGHVAVGQYCGDEVSC